VSATPTLYTLAELRAVRKPPFRVPGLIHRDLTGIAGVPYAGKSALAASLAMGVVGGSFLGRDWLTPPDRVLLVCADVGTHLQMGDRLVGMGMAETTTGVVVTPTAPAKAGAWAALSDRAGLTPSSLVIIDNLSAIVPDYNDSKACGEFFGCLRDAFISKGISVVVLLHMTEKATQYGPARLQPLGSTAISASLRHVIYVVPKGDGVLEVVTRGNDLEEPVALTVQMLSGAGGPSGFTVMDEVLVRERGASRKAKRATETLDRRAQKADWIVTNCQGRSKKATAEALAAKFGGAVSTYAKDLQPGRALGKMVVLEATAWSRLGTG